MNRSEWQFYKRQRNALFQPLRHLPKEADDTCRRRLILYCVALHCIVAAGFDQINKTRKGCVCEEAESDSSASASTMFVFIGA